MQERTTRIIVAGLSRFMDELPLVILGLIAVMIICKADVGLTEKIVMSIVTGILGYMKGKADGEKVHPPLVPPAAD